MTLANIYDIDNPNNIKVGVIIEETTINYGGIIQYITIYYSSNQLIKLTNEELLEVDPETGENIVFTTTPKEEVLVDYCVIPEADDLISKYKG